MITLEELKDYTVIEVCFWNRIYYKPEKETKSGFKFYCLEIESHEANEGPWEKTSILSTIIKGQAYFDGIRHCYFGESGYINYLNLHKIQLFLNHLGILIQEYCQEF